MLSGVEEQRLPWQEASVLEPDRLQAARASFQACDRLLSNLDTSPSQTASLLIGKASRPAGAKRKVIRPLPQEQGEAHPFLAVAIDGKRAFAMLPRVTIGAHVDTAPV